ncbi:hypothetical protein PLCT2_02867 [Planctomycetaceae bacterium]|nr:hypothetical protein PLCT2_02867 [Planctomycetaceae bacterium]
MGSKATASRKTKPQSSSILTILPILPILQTRNTPPTRYEQNSQNDGQNFKRQRQRHWV